MANAEHLKILKQGVKAWNQWQKEKLGIIPDLREANLGKANLHGANLGRANLSKANLRETDLRETYLRMAYLKEANLNGADLFRANLRETDLSGADLSRANLSGVDLSGANLSMSDLSGARCNDTSFSDIDLSEAKGLETIRHDGRSYIDVHTLILSKGKIPEIFLRGCGIPDEFIAYIPSLTGKAIEFFSCFISYSHSDKDFARRLFDTLQGRGIRCWLDEKQIKPGQDIAQEIDRGIKYWDKTILCCSKSAMTEKWWVAFEMKKALAKEQDLMRERGQHVRAIIPLDLDGYLLETYAGEYRSEIMSRSVASFKGHESDIRIFDREVERVIEALRTDEGREIPPPSRL